MRNDTVKVTALVEYHTVCAGTATRIYREARKNGKFIVGARSWEVEAFVIVVYVGVFI
jgi:hypothetical protein